MILAPLSNILVPHMLPQFRRGRSAASGVGVTKALVAHAGAGGASSGSTTSAINPTGANLIVVAVASYTVNAAPTLTDSKGNTWTGLTQQAPAQPRSRLF